MGNEKKKISKAVGETRDKSLRYIVATEPIAIGDKFSSKNISIKRTLPGISGLEPKSYNDIIGKVSASNINMNQSIQFSDLQDV